METLNNKYLNVDIFKIKADLATIRKINLLNLIAALSILFIIIFYFILNISTNYSKFKDYVDEFKEGEHPTKFNKINLGIKIMPSFNLEKNILYMRHSTDVSHKFLLNIF
jgi:hypothetical protein